jgi:hypothetical protein
MAAAVVAGLVTLVAAAGPAGAKGPTALTIVYPGKGGSVELPTKGHGNVGMGRLVEAFGLWSALDPAGAGPLDADRPEGDLGPAYRVEWTMVTPSPADPLTVTQTFYPDAPGGPVVHTDAGQPAEPYAPRTAGGWFRATDELGAALEDAGFTRIAPAPAPPAASPAADPPTAGGGVPVAGAALVLAVAAAGTAGVVAARRRRRGAAAAAG